MLDPPQVDLGEIAQALEDHSDEGSWWLDARSGEVVYWSEYSEEQGEQHPGERDCIPIEPLPSSEGYRDMEDFIALVRDPRARERLDRAIQGRGAFRRFKDTLYDFPELQQAWFAFHDARMARAALEWLRDEELIDDETAERAMAEHPDPDLPELGGVFDPVEVARRVVDDLRELYGARLKQVILYGSWARGEGDPDESDVDLMVVLDDFASPYAEIDRMSELTFEHSLANSTVVSVLPVRESELASGAQPVIVNALRDGQRVA